MVESGLSTQMYHFIWERPYIYIAHVINATKMSLFAQLPIVFEDISLKNL